MKTGGLSGGLLLCVNWLVEPFDSVFGVREFCKNTPFISCCSPSFPLVEWCRGAVLPGLFSERGKPREQPQLLLVGANESTCIWFVEPGQYRWLFSRIEEHIQIHIVRFPDDRNWSDEKGETLLRLECDLLAFAKRLSHQLDQLAYQGSDSGVSPQEQKKFHEAIAAW